MKSVIVFIPPSQEIIYHIEGYNKLLSIEEKERENKASLKTRSFAIVVDAFIMAVRSKYRLRGEHSRIRLDRAKEAMTKENATRHGREKKKAARTKLITAFRIGLYKGLIELPLFNHSSLRRRLIPLTPSLSRSLCLGLFPFARLRRKSKSNMTRNMPRNKLIRPSKVIPLHSYRDGSLIAELAT